MSEECRGCLALAFLDDRWTSSLGPSSIRLIPSSSSLTSPRPPLYSDYVENERLDRYDTMDLNDDEDFETMDAMTRAAAERKMDRRDKRAGRGDFEGGAKGKRRSRAPAFLQSDSEESDNEMNLLERRRRRNVYDEPQNAGGLDDDGDDELPLEQLSDIKANSIKEWIETEAVRRTIMKEFRNFLVTYVDEDRNSVYGQRIKALGEGESAGQGVEIQ